jgi:cytosine/adenosine deaminase-related metal-dependent hydrolase
MKRQIVVTAITTILAAGATALAQPASEWTQGELYRTLVIRNGIVVNGRGTPAEGPMDIVVERGMITDMIPVDGVSLASYGPNWKRPEGDRVIDATGMYVLPGLVDMHAHIPGDGGRAGEHGYAYGYKLWLGHGVTTLRDPGDDSGIEHLREHRRLAEDTNAAIPRLVLYQRWPNVSRQKEKGHTPDEARALVRKYQEMGADGIKVSKGPGHFPDIIQAICDEVKALGMNGVAVDLKVSETDALVASNAGVTSIEHWYGVPDAAIPGSQHFPGDYNYWNEEDRFRWAGHLWKEANEHPERIEAVIDRMIENGTVWDPTFVVYEANLDLARAKSLPWQERFTHPKLMDFWSPNPSHHASYHAHWTTADEIAWKENFSIWMHYVKEFFDRGGTLTVGSDAGSLYGLYGFSTIRELELMQQAGIDPIDIIQIATWNATKTLGLGDKLAGVRIGYTADLAIVDGNPLANFKVMYGTGILDYGADGKPTKTGGVKWTIKRGIVFDAQQLLQDVQDYVQQAKQATATNE